MRIERLAITATLVAAALYSLPAVAHGANTAALALIPPGSAAVGMMRVADLRSGPFADEFLAEADKTTVDGEARRFLAMAGLDVARDLDTVLFAASLDRKDDKGILVVAEGRFDVARLVDATEAQGAKHVSSPAGAYYLIPDKDRSSKTSRFNDESGAVAFLSSSQIILGSESTVAATLARRATGGSTFLAEGGAMAKEVRLMEALDSTGWLVIDTNRHSEWKEAAAAKHNGSGESSGSSGFANNILGAMRSVSVVSMRVGMSPETIEFAACGYTADAETRALLEDSIRGITALWRMSVQDTAPDMVPVIRSFKVSSDNEAVRIAGSLPIDQCRKFVEKNKRK